jgi:hypothetical protein
LLSFSTVVGAAIGAPNASVDVAPPTAGCALAALAVPAPPPGVLEPPFGKEVGG